MLCVIGLTRMGLMFPRILFYVTNMFWKNILKSQFLRWKLLPGPLPSQNLPGKITTPKQERKLPIKRSITVKSTPKTTQKTWLPINSPLVLPLLNYEEPMTKDVETQTDNTRFELLDHDFSLYNSALREKCPNTEFFLVRIQSEYRKIRTRKNTAFRHFSRSADYSKNLIILELRIQEYSQMQRWHIKIRKWKYQ